jgi:hypothetical protein
VLQGQAAYVLVAFKEVGEWGEGVGGVRGGDIVPLKKLLLLSRILFSLFLQPVVPICSPLQTLVRTSNERFNILVVGSLQHSPKPS